MARNPWIRFHLLEVGLLRVGLLLAGVAGAVPAQEVVEKGSAVPPLTGEDVSGRAVSWDDFGDKVVLVYFHSDRMAYSKQGLEDLLEALTADRELAGKTAILLVGTGEVDPVAVGRSFDVAGVTGRVVADPDRTRFADYHVVAFPTVFTVGPERKLRAVTKGFGPLMALKIVTAARLAAGMIDEDEYRRALESRPEAQRNADQLRLARTVRMVRQLVAAGMLDQARESLLKVVGAETDYPEALALLARILLRQGRPEDAAPWIDRLESIAPTSVDARRLRARLALLRERPDETLELLEEAPDDDPEVALLRGKAWEAKGEPERAAALYRRALETLIEERR